MAECISCNGSGKVECPTCNGSGKSKTMKIGTGGKVFLEETCYRCSGRGTHNVNG